ncbi:MotA/TolQ/ExbB proton channel [gamma proteobacterium HTCC5015]|nr:MotA/TolQ/ExbB proton channel [gamma proteobacterium HTCC5015]
METVIRFFQDGGVFMYIIAGVLLWGLAIALERYIFLTRHTGSNKKVWSYLEPLLKAGDLSKARQAADQTNSEVSRIIAYGLNRQANGRRRDDIEIAMEEGLMEVTPQLEKRTQYIATLANIATLLGLLGTIMGLIAAFTAVANANPAEKADLLSQSISVAMNTTAFGLMTGIPLLLIHYFISTKTAEVVEGLEMVSVKTLNAITESEIRN